MKKEKFAAVISSLALLAAMPVSALAVSTQVTGDVTGTANNTTGYTVTNANVNANANVGVSGSGSANGTSASGSSNTNSGATVTGSSDTNGSDSSMAGMDMSGSDSADLSVPLIVTRADLDANTVQASNVSASNVQSKNDLQGYVAAQLQSDQDLSAVDTASDHVAVTYMEPVKLFGFIPANANTTATVDENGNVTISYPWWAFLATKDNADLQTQVQSNVAVAMKDHMNAMNDEANNANVSGSANANVTANVNAAESASAMAMAQLSAADQAQLIASIQAAMKAAASANASANASATANGTVTGSSY